MGNDLTAATNAAMPHRLGRYEVVLPVASDERASVYIARVHGTEEPYVALKLLTRLHPNFATTLLEEAKPVLTLRHRNVVQLLDLGECDRGVFLAMEYLPGESLAALARSARAAGTTLPRAVAVRIIGDVLAGLHALHEHGDSDGALLGLVHLGLSARDVLVGTDGIARLSGFGVARASGEHPLLGEAWRGRSPEQAAGRSPYDRRCDVWAAGAIAWELLSGEELRLDAIGLDGPPNLQAVASDLSSDLTDAVARALRPERGERTADADAFANELEAAATASGFVAEAEDVAEVVRRLAQPKLAERRERFAEARRLQQMRPASMPDVRTMIGGVGPPLTKRLPLAELPNAPATHDDGASELRIAVAPDRRRADRADLGVLGPPSSPPPPEDDPAVIRSPLAIGDESDAATGFGGGRKAPGFADGLVRWIESPWTTRKISIVAAAGGGAFGFILVLALASRGHAAKGSALDASASALPLAATTARAGSGQDDPAADRDAGESTESPSLHLKANAPIASVQVGARLVDAVVPAPAMNVDLGADELSSGLKLVVTSTDGRVATLTTNAGDLDVEVIFGDKPKPKRPRPPGQSGPTRRPKR